jgi:hypothetical protein
MPNRKVPQHIRDYLGPCREPETPAEKVVEQCHLAKFEGDGTLSDFDPLIVIMHLVAEEVRALRLSVEGHKGRQAWIEAMIDIQNDGVLEHNTRIPCRYCDQAFEPVIDKKLLKLYLTWEKSRTVADFLAIHQCPACGGTITATKPPQSYEGDDNTPEPIWKGSDEMWMVHMLMETDL